MPAAELADKPPLDAELEGGGVWCRFWPLLDLLLLLACREPLLASSLTRTGLLLFVHAGEPVLDCLFTSFLSSPFSSSPASRRISSSGGELTLRDDEYIAWCCCSEAASISSFLDGRKYSLSASPSDEELVLIASCLILAASLSAAAARRWWSPSFVDTGTRTGDGGVDEVARLGDTPGWRARWRWWWWRWRSSPAAAAAAGLSLRSSSLSHLSADDDDGGWFRGMPCNSGVTLRLLNSAANNCRFFLSTHAFPGDTDDHLLAFKKIGTPTLFYSFRCAILILDNFFVVKQETEYFFMNFLKLLVTPTSTCSTC